MGKTATKLGTSRRGVALLVVLFIVMVITVTSLGFLARSDADLACGQNMTLRAQMDYTAESGIELARGFILHPQELPGEYWTGGTAQQIETGDDYFDVQVSRDDSDPTDRCNYTIECEAYRLKDGQKIGSSRLSAELRLDPCIALWTGAATVLSPRVTVNGDVYCGGDLSNSATINGDVFAGGFVSGGAIAGRTNQMVTQVPVSIPPVTADYFSTTYYTATGSGTSAQISQYTHPVGTFGPSASNPAGARFSSGDLELPGGVVINGTLAVAGDLSISGTNSITAEKNYPALLVDGDLTIRAGARLSITGLAVVRGQVLVSSDNGTLDVTGALFTDQTIRETVVDSSGAGRDGIIYGTAAWNPAGGRTGGALEFDGTDDTVQEPAADAYLNGLEAVTVSLWVKSDVTFEDRGIMFTRDPTGGDTELGIRYDKYGAYGGGIRGIKASIRASSGFTQIESTSNVQTTDWQHLALVWQSGQSLKLYIDGQLNPLTFDMGAVWGTVYRVDKIILGRGTKGRYSDGMIDDFRIYNRALDPNDIYPPVDGLPGLLLHWKLDERGCDVDITAAPTRTAIMIRPSATVAERWEQLGGAFFRRIERR